MKAMKMRWGGEPLGGWVQAVERSRGLACMQLGGSCQQRAQRHRGLGSRTPACQLGVHIAAVLPMHACAHCSTDQQPIPRAPGHRRP